MMLPILISVSLAPGSYFFCACAGVAIAAAETNDTTATRLVLRSILSSHLCFFKSVASRARAGKNGLIPRDETSCCGRSIVVCMPRYRRTQLRQVAWKLRNYVSDRVIPGWALQAFVS